MPDLGDDFLDLYLAASSDKHEKALNLLEEWYKGSDEDIYWYEKGMILHRLGNVGESEVCFRIASRCNAVNPLPRLGLALLLCEGQRLNEAGEQLDAHDCRGYAIRTGAYVAGRCINACR